MGRRKIPTAAILRRDLLRYCKAKRISRSELARRISQHGSNTNTIIAFLSSGYEPGEFALMEIATAFRLLDAPIDHEAVMAAILSSVTPRVYLLEAILARPEEEQDWIFAKLLARFSESELLKRKIMEEV